MFNLGHLDYVNCILFILFGLGLLTSWLHIWTIFVFAWAHSANLLTEHKLMTRGVRNFMEQSETRKAVNRALSLL